MSKAMGGVAAVAFGDDDEVNDLWVLRSSLRSPVWCCTRNPHRFGYAASAGVASPVGVRHFGGRRAHLLLDTCVALK